MHNVVKVHSSDLKNLELGNSDGNRSQGVQNIKKIHAK